MRLLPALLNAAIMYNCILPGLMLLCRLLCNLFFPGTVVCKLASTPPQAIDLKSAE